MLDPAYVRLLIRAFSVFWYGFCAVAILFGLFLLVLGLAAVLNLNLFGVKPADGPGFLALALVMIAVAVGFMAIGRYSFRLALSLLQSHPKKTDEEQFESLDSGAAQEAAAERPDMKAAEVQIAAKHISRLFWGFMGTILVFVLLGFCSLYWLSSGIRSTAHEFIAALESKNYKRAFELCSPTLQKQLGDEQTLRQIAEDGEFYEPFIWSSMGGGGKNAYLESGDVSIQFEKIDNAWRVSSSRWRTPNGDEVRIDRTGKERLTRSRREATWHQWQQQTSEIAALVRSLGGTVDTRQMIGHRDMKVWLRCHLTLRNSQFSDADLAKLVELDKPLSLYVGDRKIHEGGAIRVLHLDMTHITDGGLMHLRRMNDLTELSLTDTQITDNGLGHLKHMNNLKVLRLDRTRISDRGLVHLKDLINLQTLGLWGTEVTDDGVKEFKQALPNCKVHADHEMSGERAFLDIREVRDYYATQGFIMLGSFGKSKWPATVAYEREAMNEISFALKNGGSHHYPGLTGYRLKVVALKDSSDAEAVVVFRSEEKIDSPRAP